VLKGLDRAFKASVLRSSKRPGAALVVFLALALPFLLAMLSLKQSVRIEDQLDPTLTSSRDLKRAGQLFPDDPNVGMIILPDGNSFDQPALCSVIQNFNELVYGIPSLRSSWSPFHLRRAVRKGDLLLFPERIPDPCAPSTTGASLSLLTGTPYEGLLTSSPAGRDLAIEFQVPGLETPGPFGSLDADTLESLFERASHTFGSRLLWYGSAAREYFTFVGMRQVGMLNVALALILILGMRSLLGTWRSGFIFLGTVVCSSVFVFGAMALLGQPVDLLGASLFMILAVASLEDFIFVSDRMMESPGVENFVLQVTPAFFTSFTSVIGFGSLCTSPLPMIRRFGLWCAFGAAVEWAVIFLLLPAACAKFRSFSRWTDPRRAWLRKRMGRVFKLKPTRKLALASLLVFALAAGLSPFFRIGQDPSEMFPASHPLRKSIAYARESRDWIAAASLIFEDGLTEPERQRVASLVARSPAVKRVLSWEDILGDITSGLGNRDDRERVRKDAEQSDAYERFHSPTGASRALVYLRTTNTVEVEKLRGAVQAACAPGKCFLGGEIVAFAEFSQSLIGTLFGSLFISLLLVGAVIVYLARSLGIGEIVPLLLSSFWGPAFTLVCIGVLRAPVNSVTAVVASIVVGITGDNAIQFIFAASGKRAKLTTGLEDVAAASVKCNLLMAAGCLVFLFSYFDPPRMLGLLLATGLIAALVGEVYVLRGLLARR
jgi:predicted RND superfamily exporter protein